MRKEGRGEERDMTTHLIIIPIFAHASRVTKFSHFVCTDSYNFEIPVYDPSVGSSLPKSPRSPAETKRKAAFDYVQVFEYPAAKWNHGGAWPS